MTTTLRFPRDLLRLLYWMYFRPFTLRRYVKGFDPSLDERLALWKSKEMVGKTFELRELAKFGSVPLSGPNQKDTDLGYELQTNLTTIKLKWRFPPV